MYRASDERDNAELLAELETAADRLELGTDARSRARDVFLTTLPDQQRSERACLAASLYVGTLVAGEERSQSEVADAVGVSRITIQQRWKRHLEAVDFEAPDW